MTAITISRELGSDGDLIAAQVAQSLGYHLVDQKFIGTVMSQYGLIEFDQEYLALPGFWQRFDAQRLRRRDLVVDMLNQVIRAVARHGDVVIVGRSGYVVLAGFADVLHVRVRAPLAVRVARMAAQEGLSPEQADEVVRNSDLVRATFVEDVYGVSWESMQAFDLIVDTGRLPADRVAGWICDAARALKLTTGPMLSALRVDSVLAGAVAQTLVCEHDHA
ncbi:MAG: cytidylate kinase-like family protein [Anaerolineales bacterium]|nr:cytidylate kinase-like family protein [Anaerolineales bacterium]